MLREPLNNTEWKRFWFLPLALECRSFWYRIIANNIHCQQAIAWFRPEIGSARLFCHEPVEFRQHLLIECLAKWSNWSFALGCKIPYLHFDPHHVISILQNLRSTEYIPKTSFLLLLRCLVKDALVCSLGTYSTERSF